MNCQVDNAIIMAAGISSRFAPLSYEKPKALIPVRGEILIERQIEQLQDAEIPEIIVIVGYKKEQFAYLKEKYGVLLVENPEYITRNNNGSIYAAREYLHNSYICSADNYFSQNPFEKEVDESYYAALYAEGETKEWCMESDNRGFIKSVHIGGKNAWHMLGHTFWSAEFSQTFLKILEREYTLPETKGKYWENLFAEHLHELPMKIRKYPNDMIYEFDSLDELREFDTKYKTFSGSFILQEVSEHLGCSESDISEIIPFKNSEGIVEGFLFNIRKKKWKYEYETRILEEIL